VVAAIPPWIVAVLHDITGSFLVGWMLHLACVAVVTVLRVDPRSYEPAMASMPRHGACDAPDIDDVPSNDATRRSVST